MDMESATFLGAGIAVLGVIGSGIGIGSIFAAFISAVGRNPEAREHVFTMTMLGFALVGGSCIICINHSAASTFCFSMARCAFLSVIFFAEITRAMTVRVGCLS